MTTKQELKQHIRELREIIKARDAEIAELKTEIKYSGQFVEYVSPPDCRCQVKPFVPPVSTIIDADARKEAQNDIKPSM